MTYARAYDQTVAEDYYAAMEDIEVHMNFLGNHQDENNRTLNDDERAQLMVLADDLAQPELGYMERLEIVARIQFVLRNNGNGMYKMLRSKGHLIEVRLHQNSVCI